MEADDIRAYASGWNDAMMGREQSNTEPNYELGYLDASR